ncbi:MAG: hypothetical protein U0703_16110 [Anaerolineae bacterium]
MSAGSPAATAGLQVGDLIRGVQRRTGRRFRGRSRS